jgi:hypothetical protein
LQEQRFQRRRICSQLGQDPVLLASEVPDEVTHISICTHDPAISIATDFTDTLDTGELCFDIWMGLCQFHPDRSGALETLGPGLAILIEANLASRDHADAVTDLLHLTEYMARKNDGVVPS